MRPIITTSEQLDWNNSLVCKFTDHLIPYSLLASLFYLVLAILCAVLVFIAYDQHVRYKDVSRQRRFLRGEDTQDDRRMGTRRGR